MPREGVLRALGIAMCLGILTGLFILGGMGWPTDPGTDVGPEVDELAGDAEATVGEDIAASGVVIDADGPLVELQNRNTAVTVELDGSNADLAGLQEGTEVTFYGEITDAGVIDVQSDRIATRAPWERQYMYVISVIGAVLTGLVGANYWQVRPRQLRFEPRDRPLIPLLGRDFDG